MSIVAKVPTLRHNALVPGRFASIGFDFEDDSELQKFVRRGMREGDQIEVIGAEPGWGGKYVCWNAGSGVQLWMSVNEKGGISSVDAHYAGRGRAFISLERSYDYDTAPPTGGVVAWVSPGTEEETKAGFDLPGYARFYDLACDYDGNALVQVTAFTQAATVFDDEQALADALHAVDPDMNLAAESLLPIGILHDDPATPLCAARLSGIVLEFDTVENPATKQRFHTALVKTCGMTVDLVASDEQLAGELAVGKLVAGTVILSAIPAAGPKKIQTAGPATITITKVDDEESEAQITVGGTPQITVGSDPIIIDDEEPAEPTITIFTEASDDDTEPA